MQAQVPSQAHLDWPNIATTASLPNVSGSPTQTTDVKVGHRCYVVGETAIYVCQDATPGAAIWDLSIPPATPTSAGTMSDIDKFVVDAVADGSGLLDPAVTAILTNITSIPSAAGMYSAPLTIVNFTYGFTVAPTLLTGDFSFTVAVPLAAAFTLQRQVLGGGFATDAAGIDRPVRVQAHVATGTIEVTVKANGTTWGAAVPVTIWGQYVRVGWP